MSLTNLAKRAIYNNISIEYDLKTKELIVPITPEVVWGDGFESISEHHEILMSIKAKSGAIMSKHSHKEMRFKKGKE